MDLFGNRVVVSQIGPARSSSAQVTKVCQTISVVGLLVTCSIVVSFVPRDQVEYFGISITCLQQNKSGH